MNTSRPYSLPSWLPLALLVGASWIWLAIACAGEWTQNPDYSHGWVVLPLAAYFLWRRLAGRAVAEPGLPGSRLAWGVLVLGALAVFPLELGRLAPLYWRVFPWGIAGVTAAVTLSAGYLFGGKPYLKAAIFPLVFLASGIPWPTAFEQPLTLKLMHGVASFLGTVLPMAGIPARQEGTTLVLMTCTVGVEEACSGVRSLQSSVMLALAAGEMFRLGTPSRLLLLLCGFVLAVASNAGRTLALTVAGIQGGAAGMERIHDPAGLVALGLVAAGIFALGRWMRRGGGEDEALALAEPRPMRVRAPLAILAVGVAGYVSAWGWYAWHEAEASAPADRPGVAIRGDGGAEELPVPPLLGKSLRADSGSFGRLVLPDGQVANGFHFFWSGSRNNAGQLYHRPDSCMPEGGWTFVGPEGQAAGWIGKRPVDWAVLPYEKGGRNGVLLWAAWVDGRQIPFSVNSGSGVQRNNLWRLIANGRRTFSYETAAVLVPYAGGAPPVEEAVRAASEMFAQP